MARKALSREKKLDRYIDSDERVDKPQAGWQMNLAMSLEFAGETRHLGQDVLALSDLAVGYAGLSAPA